MRQPLEDIYNADEFGLFYQCLLGKMYQFSDKKLSGGKNSKIWLTEMAAAKFVRRKASMFIIGKSKTPQCSEYVK